MEIRLDLRNKISLAEQIRLELRKRILARELAPGASLPTVRVLAEALRVNFNTVSRAYRALDSEGLITTRQGRGTVVHTWENTVPPDIHSKSPEREQGKRQAAAGMARAFAAQSRAAGIPDQLSLDAAASAFGKSTKPQKQKKSKRTLTRYRKRALPGSGTSSPSRPRRMNKKNRTIN
jgi:DNA-binding transcriptional regulator YhcF (GntR family)